MPALLRPRASRIAGLISERYRRRRRGLLLVEGDPWSARRWCSRRVGPLPLLSVVRSRRPRRRIEGEARRKRDLRRAAAEFSRRRVEKPLVPSPRGCLSRRGCRVRKRPPHAAVERITLSRLSLAPGLSARKGAKSRPFDPLAALALPEAALDILALAELAPRRARPSSAAFAEQQEGALETSAASSRQRPVGEHYQPGAVGAPHNRPNSRIGWRASCAPARSAIGEEILRPLAHERIADRPELRRVVRDHQQLSPACLDLRCKQRDRTFRPARRRAGRNRRALLFPRRCEGRSPRQSRAYSVAPWIGLRYALAMTKVILPLKVVAHELLEHAHAVAGRALVPGRAGLVGPDHARRCRDAPTACRSRRSAG